MTALTYTGATLALAATGRPVATATALLTLATALLAPAGRADALYSRIAPAKAGTR